jgi:hypothetical protein
MPSLAFSPGGRRKMRFSSAFVFFAAVRHQKRRSIHGPRIAGEIAVGAIARIPLSLPPKAQNRFKRRGAAAGAQRGRRMSSDL